MNYTSAKELVIFRILSAAGSQDGILSKAELTEPAITERSFLSNTSLSWEQKTFISVTGSE